MNKIAIIGGGLAGLSTCFHLLQYPEMEITLFDPSIEMAASTVSTGLLHPFPGRHARCALMGKEGMLETFNLLEIAEKEMERSVADRSGILRLAITPDLQSHFQKRATLDKDAIWLDVEDVLQKVPQAIPVPGIWIPKGASVYSKLYLEGLKKACKKKGANFKADHIASLKELSSYDTIVIAAGFESLDFPECSHLPLEPVKGQVLVCRWQERLPFALVSMGHISPTQDPQICQIGSTYEHYFASRAPDPEIKDLLLKKAAAFYPLALDFEVVDIKAGVRLGAKFNPRPIVEKINPKTWVFTGLGSKGLLYHALFGKKLAQAIHSNSLNISL